MKFDFVIGNPPYQENIDNRGEQPPLYHLFYDASSKISDVVLLITPGRFLFDAGKTPSQWNQKMLNDNHFQVLKYFEFSKDVFNSVDIKGGIAIGMINKNKSFKPIEVFVKDELARKVLDKVVLKSTERLSDIIYSNTSYKYNQSFFNENKGFSDRVSGGSSRYLSSSVFEKFPEVFFENEPTDNNDYLEIIGRKNNQRKSMFVKRAYINPPSNCSKYKVFLASSNGSGILGEALSQPIVAGPNVGATETFVSFGSFDTMLEAENLEKYIKTKFARLMLGTRKVTQGNKNSKVWSNVPLQDFTENSDIDWTKSIAEIDKQLYKKYNLSQEEIDFIESHVKEME